MGKVESEQSYTSVSINVLLNKDTNEALSKAAKRAGRTKRKEAALRLEDHLQQYLDIATAGKRFTE
ncbi:TraY domain-containing protein [Yersinia aleksiciae]|uniref:TraY domain-containing protein n=1 Tax=Yersinia aleksiciae TaxID=263819 RepID=UPI0005E54233|nr:TraY domain-containing protein [Yersinia aleksiciae]CNI65466.1 conjugal transfer protein TraY [Yersinia frederiksenii]